MSNCDGLDPKNLDDLIAQLSHCQKAAPGDRIPVRDVKEILQQAGLLESLLQERPSAIEGAAETIEPQSHRRKSPFAKRFFALAAAIGFSGMVGYNIGADHAISSINLTDVRKYTSNEKSNIGKTNIGDMVGSTRAYPPYFSLIYQGCKRSGAAVKCSVDVITKTDSNYKMGEKCTIRDNAPDHIRLFDSKGGVYKADLIEFGDALVGGPGRLKCSRIRLLADVPVTAILTFKNVDPGTKIIKALEISIATSSEAGTEWYNPQFRELAIE
jgi:hypothetical protein